jgi:hypothetical protein
MSVTQSGVILDNLLKTKKISNDIRSSIRDAQSDALRLQSIVSGLARGDVTSLVLYLSRMGPYGVAAALAIAGAAVAYGIYQQLTAEKPTEYYYWRYSK